MRHALAVLASLILTLFAANAPAQDNKTLAREKFSEATAAHARGEYAEAARLFEEAHRLAPAAGAKFNAGIAWDQAGELPRAADAYELALDMGGLTEDEAEQAQTRLGALKKVLGYVRIDRPIGARVSIEQLEDAPIPARLHVRPGRHELELTMDDRTMTRVIQVGAAEVKEVSLEGERALPSKPRRSVTKSDVREGREPDRDKPPVQRSSAQKTWGWIAIGTGAVLAGTAIVLGVRTLNARDKWDDNRHQEVALRNDAVTLRNWTNVAWGGAAVAGGVGTVLLLTAPTVEF